MISSVVAVDDIKVILFSTIHDIFCCCCWWYKGNIILYHTWFLLFFCFFLHITLACEYFNKKLNHQLFKVREGVCASAIKPTENPCAMKCKDRRTCIPASKVCNFFPDCAHMTRDKTDASDEEGCDQCNFEKGQDLLVFLFKEFVTIIFNTRNGIWTKICWYWFGASQEAMGELMHARS